MAQNSYAVCTNSICGSCLITHSEKNCGEKTANAEIEALIKIKDGLNARCVE